MRRLLPSRHRNNQQQADIIQKKLTEQVIDRHAGEKSGTKLGEVLENRQGKTMDEAH